MRKKILILQHQEKRLLNLQLFAKEVAQMEISLTQGFSASGPLTFWADTPLL